MTYRNDLAAAQARANSLEERLALAEERVNDLENPPTSSPQLEPSRVPVTSGSETPKPKRGITFRLPRPLLPALWLWFDGMRTASRRVPSLPCSKFETDTVALAILFRLVWVPLIHLFRVLYVVHLFLLVAPWTLFLSTLLSLPVAIILFIGGFQFGESPPDQSNVFERSGGGSNYLWFLLSCLGQPLLPLFVPGWDEKN